MADEQNNSSSGAHWRLLAGRGATRVEVANTGVFDELVLDDWFHLENIDVDAWWIRVGDARIMVAVVAGSDPVVEIQRGFYAAVSGTTTTYSRP
jgi:hypothetical protein